MAIRKFLYVDANGDYIESTGAYETSDFISSGGGISSSAGLPVVLDSNGLLDSSFINESAIDHGNLSGLLDDDHTQYILVDGTRAFTGDVDAGSNNVINVADSLSSSHAVNRGELDAEIAALNIDSVEYTAGSTIAAGDAVFVSGNDEASTYSTITNAEYVVGLALSGVSSGGTVEVLRNDTIISGVLTGATAGDKYFWSGSGLTTAIPSGPNEHCYLAGIAKNATDLHVQVEFIKVNSA
jgi:hypothetical protein